MDLNHKHILLLGYGLEGQASFYYLRKEFPNSYISIADSASNVFIEDEVRKEINNVYLGEDWLRAIAEVDVVIRSPGIPPKLILENTPENKNIFVTSATDIFLRKHFKRTIGITGTKGKSTTSSLLKDILESAGLKVILVGNIGKPALSSIEEEPDYFIYELSSYQLQDISVSPNIALFLNFYPEHLDHHGNSESYFAAKSKIFIYQSESDTLIVSKSVFDLIRDNVFSNIMIYDGINSDFFIKNKSIFNNTKELLGEIFFIETSSLKGVGNLNNILALFHLIKILKIDLEKAIIAINNFKLLPHRLEVLGEKHSVIFVNDSISTVPQATLNALDAFFGQVKVLVAGGYDRGLDYSDLVKVIVESKINLLLLFRPSGQRIFDSLTKYSFDSGLLMPKIEFIENMDDIIKSINKNQISQGVCLLSPASPSFGKFKNFEQRGEFFREMFLKI